jgi:hypothetical protein
VWFGLPADLFNLSFGTTIEFWRYSEGVALGFCQHRQNSSPGLEMLLDCVWRTMLTTTTVQQTQQKQHP